MKVSKNDISRNSDVVPIKYYLRSVYHCESDDIWIVVEIPKEEK